MTVDIHNWSSSVHQEIHKIVKDEIFPIVNQVDARVQNFEIYFLKETAKFVRDFKSLAKEADESLDKHKAMELEIKRLLRAVVSQDIMSIVQNPSVVPPKVVELNDLSNPVTSNSVPTIKESKVVENNKVIAPGMFRIDPRVESIVKTRRPQPRSNTKNDRVPFVSKSSCIKDKDFEVEEHHRILLLSKNKKYMSSECNNINLAILNDKSEVVCAICHSNLSWEPSGLENDHVAAILGYGDLQRGNILITEVYFVKGLGHNLFSVGQFYDSDLEAEAIATVCFTQNRSIIHRRFDKKPYELINSRKPDIFFLYVFEALCYPKNDREDFRKLGAKGDIGFFIGYSANSCAYRFYNRRTKKIMETMNVTFDELLDMAFEQSSSRPGLQSMTS
ncbi:retrovirus-related pol polyprotein from transposon TNT 1-94 [Tanacetum coccineum]